MSNEPPRSPGGGPRTRPAPGRAEADSREEQRYRRLVLVIVLIGIMIAAVDTTIVVLGLPVMMRELHTDMVSMIWVIMAYLLVLTMLSTQVGRFGDMYGRVRMYNLGFVVFTVGSVLCGLSSSAPELIAFRVAQAVGGALISSNSAAIIADTMPPKELGRAYGLTGIGWSVGAVLGILLGGLIITFVSWRYIFYINLPIGAVALFMSYRILRERSPRLARRIDFVGMALLGVGLLLLLLGLTTMTGTGPSLAVAVQIAAGALLIVAFVAWERRFPAPMLDMSFFRRRVLTASCFAAMFQGLGSYAVMFLVIMYLQGVRGLSPFNAALVLIPGYVVGGFIGPWSGRIADRRGARLPATLGLVLQAIGMLLYAALDPVTPLWFIVLASVVNGVGSGFFYPSNSSAAMADAPPQEYGVASGVLRTLGNVGMVGSFAVALLVSAAAIPRSAAFAIFLGTSRLTGELAGAFVHGLHAAFIASIALIAIAAVLSLLRGPHRPPEGAS